MYRGIVEPHLRYCCSVWGHVGGLRLQGLQKLQNRAARIVTNSSYDCSASALIKTLNWPMPAKSVYGIHDPSGLSHLTQLRVGLSKLNFNKFKHIFKDTINPMCLCPTNDSIEDTEHFLLLCPSFDVQQRDLLAGIAELLRPFVQITNLSNDALTQLLLYGDQDLSYDLKKIYSNFVYSSFTKLVALTKIFQASIMSQSNHHVH